MTFGQEKGFLNKVQKVQSKRVYIDNYYYITQK